MSARKTCFACGVEKELSSFYPHPQMADGHLNKCSECCKEYSRKFRRERIEEHRAYDRERSKTPDRKNAAVIRTKERRLNDRRYAKAHNDVRRALKNGKLVFKPCEMCGTKDYVHAHHDDYDKPLEVMWLCPEHHSARHAFLRYFSNQNNK